MNLRDRIRLAAAFIRGTGLALILTAAFLAKEIVLGLVGVIIWLRASSPILRRFLLPAIFPTTVCAGCLRTVPLLARWKCGDHFTDHRERHILDFHCNQGHVLEGFNCPRCGSTILVQRGNRQLLRHGAAIRMRTVTRLPAEGILLGHDTHGREVRLPWAVFAFHAAIFGGTGRGKSTLLLNIILQLLALRVGFTLIDCGDLARTVRNLLPADRQDEVLYLDVADTVNPFSLNILSAATALEQALLAEELLEVFRRMYGSSWGPVLEHQLRMGLRAAISAKGSLRDVYDLFTDAGKRARILARVTDWAAKSFWVNEFPTIPAIRRAAVVNKLAPIVFHPILGPIICGRECVLNADEIIANHRIVIVSLWTGSPADDVTGLLGTFIVQRIIAAAFRQGAVPESQRALHALLIDEFARFVNHRAAAFDQILVEARRYRLSLTLASQYVGQIDLATRSAIFGNVGALIAFRLGHQDARMLTDEFTGSVVEDFTDLGVGRCMARIGTDWNLIRTQPPPRFQPIERPRSPIERQPPTVSEDQVSSDDPAEDENDDFIR
jgi:hypothetical protein